ncbi:unnamed protein product [Rotaria socialis]|uniref:Uncharacterized protein n=1 Tax=Rotaria socialis TaxID=392032 RepID=A0A820UF12_9BILA|nr:unnamed protein product [Rotaria socialis]
MLQHKLYFYGKFFLKTHSQYRVAYIARRTISYDQHESPTVPHHIHSTPTLKLTEKLPSSCHILIAGGGIIGQSIAYHLSEIGVKDVVLIEKAKLASGATWQSSGRVSLLHNTVIETHFAKYSRQLYEKLHKEGHDIGFHEIGSIWIAQTPDRLHTLQRQYSAMRALGIGCEILKTEKVVEKIPIINQQEIWGGLLISDDIMVDPVPLCLTFARSAIDKGVKIIEDCYVTEILTEKQRAGQYDRVTSAVTSQGEITCDAFINCTGMAKYVCLKTKSIGNFPSDIPIVHNPEERFYIQPLLDHSLLIGGFLRQSKPVFTNGVPDTFHFSLLPDNWDDFHWILSNAIKRFPILAESEYEILITGADSYTPDGRVIMNESAEVTLAGGIGKYMAELIHKGNTDFSTWPVDIRRFMRLHTNKRFLEDRLREIPGKQYSLKYPTYGMSLYRTGRKLRVSPLHSKLQAAGAVYGEVLGYERPLFFKPDEADKNYEDLSKQGTFSKARWFNTVKKEYNVCRKGVAIIDMTSFTKYELKSANRSVVDFLQMLCANNIDKPIGTVVHTGMLNEQGGYENDCSVIRLGEYHFLLVSPTAQSTRNMKWLKSHVPEDGSVLLSDVTSLYTALNVIGPKAKYLLAELSDEDFNDFARMTCQEIDVGFVSHIYAMRLTHTGEDGFMLYIPSEYALCVYDMLMEQGKDYGIINAGYFAQRTLRIERMYPSWGHDIDKKTTPFHLNREYHVSFDKEFIGKEALLKQRKVGMQKRFVQFLLENHNLDADPWPWSGEPIYRNGEFCGFVTSSAYGFTLGKQVCLGHVHAPSSVNITMNYIRGATYEIDIATKRFRARPNLYQPSEMGPTVQLNMN